MLAVVTGTMSARIRVLHVLPRFIGGGPERSVLTMARIERALNIPHEHSIAVLDAPLSARLVVHAKRHGFTSIGLVDKAQLQDQMGAADVVLVHYWNHPELVRLLLTWQAPAARIAVWARVLGTTAPQVLPHWLGTFADLLIVTSRRSLTSEAATTALDLSTPVEFVPGVLDPSRLIDDDEPAPASGRVGYIGSTSPTKCHPRFVELAAAVPADHAVFDVYGSGGDNAELMARATRLGLEGRFHVHGHTEDVGRALASFDVFGYPLAPDTSATSEKALQEAMWLGVPPVILDHSGAVDLVHDGTTGIIAHSETEYSLAIARLLDDDTLRIRMGKQAKRWIRTEYDPSRWTRFAAGLVADLALQPRASRPALRPGPWSPATAFVASLGSIGEVFARSLAANSTPGDAFSADRDIARSAVGLANGEGGVLHYRNTFPSDPYLRLWSGLLMAGQGRHAAAIEEFRAASRLGLPDDRAESYASMIASDEFG